MARKVSYLSYNMTTADANNQDGLVPFGRQWDFIGDVETEQMILNDGDESLCLGYHDCKIYEDASRRGLFGGRNRQTSAFSGPGSPRRRKGCKARGHGMV